MSISANFNPLNLDFGNIRFGDSRTTKGVSTHAPSNAMVSASIIEGVSFFKVESVNSVSLVWEPTDPSELTHHKPNSPPSKIKGKPVAPDGQYVYRVTESSDGSTPVAILQGQLLSIEVVVSAPSALQAVDILTGMLLIQGDMWDPVHIPLSMELVQVDTQFSSLSLSIRQGQSVDLPIVVHSVGGPGTTVTYTLLAIDPLSPPVAGMTMTPQTVSITRDQSVTSLLHFTASPDAPLGKQSMDILELAYNDQQSSVYTIALTILPGDVSVILSDFTVSRGGSFGAPLHVSLQGVSTVVTVSAAVLPAGVSMSPVNVSIDTGGSAMLSVPFQIDTHAPTNTPPLPLSSPLMLNWSAYDGQVVGTFTAHMTILHAHQRWPFSPFSAGQVDCTNATILCYSDGTWVFSGDLHDNSSLYGDNYSIGFVFDADGMAAHADGELGASLTRPSENAHFKVNGNDPQIEQNWPSVFAGGTTVKLHVAANVGQAFSDLGDDFRNVGKVIGRWLDGNSSTQGGAGGQCFGPDDPNCPGGYICENGVCVPDMPNP